MPLSGKEKLHNNAQRGYNFVVSNGKGSGFIVRHDGAIVTNYHVINNAKAIAVKAGEKALERDMARLRTMKV